ncbi:MAG: hypothetical protein HQL98_01785 [Magnetococcales bacterium]|nr:hypothetical protein [Magnetococcales bacterium]
MNVLQSMIALLGRSLYFMVALGILVGMPYSAHLLWNAYQDHIAASERLDEAKRIRAELDRQMEKIQEYRKFSTEVRTFVKSAEDNRLDERQGWTTYKVDIKEKLITVSELRALLINAGPSSRFYFKPKKLEITSLFAKESLPPSIVTLMTTKAGMGPGAPTTPPPVPGEKVLLSLTGHYLVFPRS